MKTKRFIWPNSCETTGLKVKSKTIKISKLHGLDSVPACLFASVGSPSEPNPAQLHSCRCEKRQPWRSRSSVSILCDLIQRRLCRANASILFALIQEEGGREGLWGVGWGVFGVGGLAGCGGIGRVIGSAIQPASTQPDSQQPARERKSTRPNPSHR